MPDANPWADDPENNPYEVLGLSPTASEEDIMKTGRKLMNKHSQRAKGADPNEKRRHEEAFKNIQKAMKAAEQASGGGGRTTTTSNDSMSVDCLTDGPSTGEPALFVVRNDDGDRLSGVKLDHDGRTRRTDGDGQAEFSFPTPGDKTVIASKGGYEDASIEVTVEDRVNLQVAPTNSDVTAGPTQFKVTDGSDTPIDGATVTVSRSRESATTGRGGIATVDIDQVGKVTVTAEKSEGSTNYVDATTTVDVEKASQDLDLSVGTSNPEAGKEIKFEVVNGEGNSVGGVFVEAKTGESDRTGENGIAKLTLDAGRIPVRARKQDNEVSTFDGDQITVSVAKQDASLRIEVGEDVVAGKPTQFRVVDGNRAPVENSRVSTDRGHAETTDGDGEVEVTFRSEGTVRVEAEKDHPRYDYDDVAIDVDVGERELDLAFDSAPNALSTDERGEFKIVDENTGDPFQGALLIASNGDEKRTDSDGKATFTFSEPQVVTVMAEVEDASLGEIPEERLIVN